MSSTKIDYNNIKLVIFDVDGTLYNQSKLRFKMIKALSGYYLWRPFRYKEILILHHFRKERGKKHGYYSPNLESEQYEWCAAKMKLPLSVVMPVIDRWIFEVPLRYIRSCVFTEAAQLIKLLKNKNIKTAAYSDYRPHDKLAEMRLSFDRIVSSTDRTINCFKPTGVAIENLCAYFNISKNECILIGDRHDRDGLSAEITDIRYVHLPRKNNEKRKMFVTLSNSFNSLY